MKIRKFLVAAPIILAVTVLAVMVTNASADPVSAECGALSAWLEDCGVEADSCEYDAETDKIKICFRSKTDEERITADDISSIRTVRNGVRYEINTLKTLSGAAEYNEVMTNSAGKVLLDSNMDLQTIPPFPECAELRENIPVSADIEDLCSSLMSEYPNITLNTIYNENIGTMLEMSLDYDDIDFDAINSDIADIMRYVDKYNQDSAAVQQTKITVYAGGEKVLFSSSDLVYRDFLWWQTPQMTEVWTHY